MADISNAPTREVLIALGPSPAAQLSLSRKLKSGVLWVTALSAFRDLLQFGIMLILVRILEPKSYGQFGLVSALIGFFTVFSFRNFLEHTLQARPNEIVDYQTHFTIGGLIQICMLIAVNLFASVLTHIDQYREITPLLRAMSVFFLLDWASEFRVKMLERSLEWKRLRLLQGIGLVSNALAALTFALLGFGVYALLLPGLMSTLPFIVDLFLVKRWRPNWIFDRRNYSNAWKYGLTRIGSGLLSTGQRLLESTILVQVLGFASFGVFGRANSLANICYLKIPSLLALSLYPVLSKINPGTPTFSRSSGLILRSVAWIVIPAGVALSVLANPAIRLVYGEKWLAAIPLLPWTIAVSAITALVQISSLLLLAHLQQAVSLTADAITFAGTGLCLLVLLPRGIPQYLLGAASVQTVALAVMLVCLHRAHGLTWQGIRAALFPPATAILSGFAVYKLLAAYWDTAMLTTFASVGAVLGFLLMYVVGLRLLCSESLGELVAYMPASTYIRRILFI